MRYTWNVPIVSLYWCALAVTPRQTTNAAHMEEAAVRRPTILRHFESLERSPGGCTIMNLSIIIAVAATFAAALLTVAQPKLHAIAVRSKPRAPAKADPGVQ